MPPSEDAELLLGLVRRHLRAMELTMADDYPAEDWGFTAQQAVENLLKALIVLADERPPLTHELRPLAAMARQTLPPDLMALQTYAGEARYRPGPFPLPESRQHLTRRIGALHRQVLEQLERQRKRERDQAEP